VPSPEEEERVRQIESELGRRAGSTDDIAVLLVLPRQR